MKTIISALIIGLVALSCNKIEGQGGAATIEGTLKVKNLDGQGNFISAYPGADEDIFIIYGKDGKTYHDKVATSYDGSFYFNYLTPGDYQIFAYSKCDTCDSGKDIVLKNIVITDKKEVVNTGEIVIYD